MAYKRAYINEKETLYRKEWKHNAILTMFHETNTKKLDIILVDKKLNIILKLNKIRYLNPVRVININI